MAKKEKKQKEPKRKPKYGVFSCIGYIYRLLWKYEKGLVFTCVLTIPLSLILTVISLYTPSLILSTLETANRFSYVALVIIGLLLSKLFFDLGNTIIQAKIGIAENYVREYMCDVRRGQKRSRDWHLRYDPELDKLDDRALEAVQNVHSAGVHFPMEFSNMLTQILNFFLFGSVISLLHPAIILLLALGCLILYFVSRWERTVNRKDIDMRNSLDRKITYLTFRVAQNLKYGKEIRLYNMAEPLRNHLTRLFDLRANIQKKEERRSILAALADYLILLIRDGAAYVFLIYKAVQGEVDASSFVLYFSAIGAMSALMTGILGVINRVLDGALQVSDYREELEIPNYFNHGNGIPVPKKPFSIEFRNVSFRYPLGEKKILDNVSFRIEPGEKIALVGLNGAGKTTLTMLMSGLLVPDEGEILLDGQPLVAYNYEEMHSLFGLVPQDYHILPISIAKNITAVMTEDQIDFDKLNKCIETAGLNKKIASLKNGVNTTLNRQIDPDGIELSGGEMQKLLLARMLYKNPMCIILDEPTAALDPIAEDRMYRQYNEIAANATVVFISHRLASTRFCDRIFLLDGATLAEEGTHEELLTRGKKYRELFDIQSKYYREGVEKDDE